MLKLGLDFELIFSIFSNNGSFVILVKKIEKSCKFEEHVFKIQILILSFFYIKKPYQTKHKIEISKNHISNRLVTILRALLFYFT